MEKCLVSIKNLAKSYFEGDRESIIFQNIDLDVKRGEQIAIMGPSGSGKSTLLNITSGLDEVTAGSVTIAGHNLSEMSLAQRTKFRRRNLGFIFQSFNLVQSLTALENVMLPLLMNGYSRSKAQKEAIELLMRVNLDHRKNAYPNKLSGGEKQRVAIIRALIHHPQIVFADEPTGNLDRTSSEEVIRLMKELCKEFNQTMIIVTHDQSVAESCDRIFSLNGQLTEIT
ncbi:MAG: ABC transporter ATP-binding protein [Candidatus Hermodarchaeota archaeon]